MANPVPTNLVMGFLGVGKTTAIRRLLEDHPAGERWAVLVNELGEVGIDGELLATDGVAVKQVPGGCLCCVTAGAFAAGLAQLVRETRPHRLLIEPSGIGHPTQVIAELTSGDLARGLDLRATVTLVDARKLADKRYLEHPVFTDQLEVADVLVANKLDTYGDADRERFYNLVRAAAPPKAAAVMVEGGRFPRTLLDQPRGAREARFPAAHDQRSHHHDALPSSPAEEGWLRVEGHATDAHTVGWRIDGGKRFVRRCLEEWVAGLGDVRVKGVVATDAGWRAVNVADGETRWSPHEPAAESRLEVIAFGPLAGLDAAELDRGLRGCAAGGNRGG